MYPRIISPGFAFVLTRLDIPSGVGMELSPGYNLAKATSEQIKMIKHFLAPYGEHNFSFRYESEEVVTKTAHGVTTQRQGVGLDRWSYWVVNYDVAEHHMFHLERAFRLVEPPVEIGPWISVHPVAGSPTGRSLHPASVFSYFNDRSTDAPPVIVTDEMRHEVGKLFDELRAVESEPSYREVLNAITDYEYTFALPRRSSFGALALFAVLEAVLTHESHNDYDSITHQTATKMTLLGKRFSHPLVYSAFRDGHDTEKTWKKLYAYRSAVAHGSQPDFERKLKTLKDEDTVITFMRTAVRRLLVYYLLDPEFVEDLKRC